MKVSDAPSVTVTFIAWQRPEALRRGIESCLAQTYKNIEIVVIDNSPTDKIHRWLLHHYPIVKSIKTPRPISLPAARNLAVATAAGEFVIFHDDDSYFSSPEDVKTAVGYLETRPNVACLAFRVGSGEGDWNPQFDAAEICPTYIFIACAVMFRRTDFAAAGWYFEKFWLYGEERVVSLGFFGIGKEIHFFPQVTIIHRPESAGRVSDNAARYWTADVVMVGGAALLKFPFPQVFFWYPILTVFYILQVALLRRRPLLSAAAGLKAVLLFPALLRQRSPIPRKEYKRWLSTRAHYNKEYLKRTGRWRWYHRLLPAVG
jgi:glycosyltransferase involved in cell wall biosynthesis